ncbi:response regulator transcription factor [Pseudalkalibacillus decolorationis]|uniref:response regulator transcription factor n=1 Tax=Pseudalkalibacillus decolorationis TaxID=163879 RepID=UPI0021498277|nr:response regulator transcription factor [Pseudalkalibacillus decolorationis]
MFNMEGITDKKILLVDDEEDIVNMLETVLYKEGFRTIYKAMEGLDAVQLCKEKNPDLIVLDIMLPDIDGLEVCRRIREFSYAPIIFLSVKTDDVDKLLGLGIGGDDYVTKPFSPKEVAFRIKAQFRRTQYLGNRITTKPSIPTPPKVGPIEIDPNKGEVTLDGKLVTLTAKEYQLLLYMAENTNRILSKQRICEQVWGEDYLGYDNTIMVHIRHLREKLEADPGKPIFIKTIKGLGYKLTTRGE